MNKEQGEERLRLLFIRSVLFDVVEPLATDVLIFKLLGPTHGLPSRRAKTDQVTASGRGY
jgi:hypothetical protein